MVHDCKIINGKLYAKEILDIVKDKLAYLEAEKPIKFGLAVILVGDDPASTIYVNNKAKQAKSVGLESYIYKFSSVATESEVINCINNLNQDADINGILVQLPLPKHIDTQKIIDTVHHQKDVDGFCTYNVGLLNSWQDSLEPCTPQ